MEKEVSEGFRLSPQQAYLWTLQGGQPDPAYCIRCSVRIDGQVSANTLEASLQRVVRQHEILRTAFRQFAGEPTPYQIPFSGGELPVSNVDLSSLTPAQQDAKLEALSSDASRFDFDLTRPPLMRVQFVTLSPSSHMLFISMPSLCADKATIKNILKEISRACDSSTEDEATGGTETVQYIDLAEWQNDLLESEETKLGRQFWTESGWASPLATSLPGIGEPFGNSPFAPRGFKFTIEPSLAGEGKALAAGRGVSVAAWLLTVWQVLLARLSGSVSVVIGTAFDGRRTQEVESSLGLFSKHLPVRGDFGANPSFGEAVRRTNAAMRDAHKWQEFFSWEQTREGEPPAHTFFPFCFEHEEASSPYLTRDAAFTITEQEGYFDRFALKLSCLESEESLHAELHYDSNLVQLEDVEQIAAQFQTLLAIAASNPDIQVNAGSVIDNRGVPPANAFGDESERPYVAPGTPLEKQLTEIWAKFLGLERVGVNDHFFDIGGHSLLATQIVYAVREVYPVEVPLSFFFTHEPTVAGLAAAIERNQIELAEEADMALALEELDELSDEEVRVLLSED